MQHQLDLGHVALEVVSRAEVVLLEIFRQGLVKLGTGKKTELMGKVINYHFLPQNYE